MVSLQNTLRFQQKQSKTRIRSVLCFTYISMYTYIYTHTHTYIYMRQELIRLCIYTFIYFYIYFILVHIFISIFISTYTVSAVNWTLHITWRKSKWHWAGSARLCPIYIGPSINGLTNTWTSFWLPVGYAWLWSFCPLSASVVVIWKANDVVISACSSIRIHWWHHTSETVRDTFVPDAEQTPIDRPFMIQFFIF